MEKAVFFATSYLVIPALLYFVEKEIMKKKEIIIICELYSMYKLLELFNFKFFSNKINLIYLENFELNNFGKIKKTFLYLYEFFYIRQIYKKKLKKLNNSNIYFFHTVYIERISFFIKKLSLKNNIILSDVNIKKITGILKKENYFKKIIYSKDIEKIIFNKTECSILTEKYLNKYVNKMIDYNKIKEKSNKINEKYKKKMNINFSNYDLIFFDQPLLDYIEDLEKKNEFEKKISEIFEENFKNILIKNHPSMNSPSLNCKANIEKYIPAEYLYNFKTKYYITYFSSSMFEIKNINNKYIMLFYLIPIKNKEKKIETEKYILNRINNKKIFLPKSFEELIDIIKSNK